MRIMTTDTGIGTWPDPLVGEKETIGLLLMAISAELTYIRFQQRLLSGAMGIMTGRAIFGGRLMQGAITPKACHVTMAL